MKYVFVCLTLFLCSCEYRCTIYPLGSFVELKSGGPKMIVARCEQNGDGEVDIVEWIDTLGRPQTHVYYDYELRGVK